MLYELKPGLTPPDPTDILDAAVMVLEFIVVLPNTSAHIETAPVAAPLKDAEGTFKLTVPEGALLTATLLATPTAAQLALAFASHALLTPCQLAESCRLMMAEVVRPAFTTFEEFTVTFMLVNVKLPLT